jgi:hypothetical protein
MRKRNRFTLLLAMPIVVFLWIVGWSLSWIGSSNKKAASKKRPIRKELSFAVLMPEQKYAK